MAWYLPFSSAGREFDRMRYRSNGGQLVYSVRLQNNPAHKMAYWTCFVICLVLQLVSLFFIRWFGWFFLLLAFRYGWYIDCFPHELRIIEDSDGRRRLGICFGLNPLGEVVMPIGTKDTVLEISEAQPRHLALSLGCSENLGCVELHNWAVEAGENTHVAIRFDCTGFCGRRRTCCIVLTPDMLQGDKRVSAVDAAARIAAEMELEKNYLEKNYAQGKKYYDGEGLELSATRYTSEKNRPPGPPVKISGMEKQPGLCSSRASYSE